jgi:hypothetical protein
MMRQCFASSTSSGFQIAIRLNQPLFFTRLMRKGILTLAACRKKSATECVVVWSGTNDVFSRREKPLRCGATFKYGRHAASYEQYRTLCMYVAGGRAFAPFKT